jgi:HEAT repeat protein
MRRRRKALFLAAAGLVVAGLALVAWWLREPRYEGKSLSSWVEPWRYGGDKSPESMATALKAMGDRAVFCLIDRLQWRPPQWKRKLRQFLPRWAARVPLLRDGEDPRWSAAYALALIGKPAAPAIPYLSAVSTAEDTSATWEMRAAAKAALIRIKGEPLTPYIESLRDTSDIYRWPERAAVMGYLGTNASEAVPLLVQAMINANNHKVIRLHAAGTLGNIHSRPEVCVGPLARMLNSADLNLRATAMFALSKFGQAAKPARHAIVQCLNDSDAWVRSCATNILKKIDSDQTRRVGIK